MYKWKLWKIYLLIKHFFCIENHLACNFTLKIIKLCGKHAISSMYRKFEWS